MDNSAKNKEVQIPSDIEILENLKRRIYEAICENPGSPKLGDLLKVMEMKNKLSVSGKAEKKFWEMINRIRDEELPGKKKPVPTKKNRPETGG
nr:hypothetical protein [candidate division Zixibacteria bacterium]